MIIRLATLLILVAVLLIGLWLFQRRLIYFPFGAVPAPGDVGLPRAESVTFTTDDGLTLGGWFVPADRPGPRVGGQSADGEVRPGAPLTVLFFSGNAGNRSMRAPLAAALAARGISTLLVDYRGYGGNPGAPSEDGLASDARAARRYLAARPDVDAARIVYFGESLGSGVAVRLAAEEPPLALILRSPYTSLVDVGRYHYPLLPVRALLRDTFSSLERMPLVRSPLLVVAAREDRIVPTPLSERLFAAAPVSPKQLLVIEVTEHNDYELLAGRQVIDAIVDFLNRLTS